MGTARFPIRGTVEGLPTDVGFQSAVGPRVYIADGNAFFNRPGPRIVDSLEILAACIHPELFADLAAQHAESFRAVSS